MEQGKLVLQLLHESHINAYLAAFSNAVQAILHASAESEKNYLIERLRDQNTFFYTIFFNKSLVGAIEIRDNPEQGQLYCWIAQNHWGSGIFQHAIARAAQNYFDQTDALYFTAHVDINNKRSYRALKKAGFADYGLCNGPRGKQYVLLKRRPIR